MAEESEPCELSTFLAEHLRFFDELLSSTNVPLSQRPLRAALLFVEHCVVSVKDGDKKDALGQTWFKAICYLVSRWYGDVYAGAMGARGENHATGVVLIYNTPFALDIPITLMQPEKDNKARITFPNDVLLGENVIEWLVSPPNLQRLSEEELSRVKEDISDVASMTRNIGINLMTAKDEGHNLWKLISSIPVHIDKAVKDILSHKESSMGLAVWEMHLAVEKSLKVLLRQHGGSPKKIHDLGQLATLATEVGISIDKTDFQALPSHGSAIDARYGDWSPTSVHECIANYRTVLKLLRQLTKALKREIILNNASFLVAHPGK